MTINKIIKEMDQRKKMMAKERDKLRSLESECSELSDTYDEAIEALEIAADTLSQYV